MLCYGERINFLPRKKAVGPRGWKTKLAPPRDERDGLRPEVFLINLHWGEPPYWIHIFPWLSHTHTQKGSARARFSFGRMDLREGRKKMVHLSLLSRERSCTRRLIYPLFERFSRRFWTRVRLVTADRERARWCSWQLNARPVGSETLSYRRLCINILIKCPRSDRAFYFIISIFSSCRNEKRMHEGVLRRFLFSLWLTAPRSRRFSSLRRAVTNFIQIGRRQIKGMAG